MEFALNALKLMTPTFFTSVIRVGVFYFWDMKQKEYVYATRRHTNDHWDFYFTVQHDLSQDGIVRGYY